MFNDFSQTYAFIHTNQPSNQPSPKPTNHPCTTTAPPITALRAPMQPKQTNHSAPTSLNEFTKVAIVESIMDPKSFDLFFLQTCRKSRQRKIIEMTNRDGCIKNSKQIYIWYYVLSCKSLLDLVYYQTIC